LHQYDHGHFRVVAYFVSVEGELRCTVHDRLEWVKIGDLSGYKLLPGDIPITASLRRQQLLG
jgi:hypothetical protein